MFKVGTMPPQAAKRRLAGRGRGPAGATRAHHVLSTLHSAFDVEEVAGAHVCGSGRQADAIGGWVFWPVSQWQHARAKASTAAGKHAAGTAGTAARAGRGRLRAAGTSAQPQVTAAEKKGTAGTAQGSRHSAGAHWWTPRLSPRSRSPG